MAEEKPALLQNLKLPLYEIINIDDGALKVPSIEQDNLVQLLLMQISDYAHQCASFLTWVDQPHANASLLAEILWKNEMRIKAGDLYPELDN